MFLVYILLSSFSNAIANLFIRKSVEMDQAQKGDPFLFERLLSATLIVALVTICDNGVFSSTTEMTILGVFAGLQLGALMLLTGRAVKTGPSALSFAFLNSATVAPPLIMAILFGSAFGHYYTFFNALGALLVIIGLFWMAKRPSEVLINPNWIKWIFLAFFLHAFYLAFFQWRALLLEEQTMSSFLLPFHCSSEGADSFTFWMFLTATLFQGGRQWITEHKSLAFTRTSIRWGMGGGLLNGLGGYFTMRATEVACGGEKALIFPLYCVTLIFLCNLWGRYFYKEQIHWPSMVVCFVGIFLGLM